MIHLLFCNKKADRKLGNRTNQVTVGGLDLNFNLDINQNANLEIVVDKQTGSTINGNGNGGLLFKLILMESLKCLAILLSMRGL